MKPSKTALALFMAAALGSQALAQTAPANVQNRQRLRESISDLRLLRMTQVLDLTEDQTAKIFPVFNRIEKQKAALQVELALKLRQLRAALRQPPFEEGEILRTAEALRELQGQLRAKDDEFEAFLDRVLTPVQKGRYIIFSVDFYRGLGENLDRLRETARAKIKRSA